MTSGYQEGPAFLLDLAELKLCQRPCVPRTNDGDLSRLVVWSGRHGQVFALFFLVVTLTVLFICIANLTVLE